MPISPIYDEKVKTLQHKANEIREDIVSMLFEAGSGHSAGPLGMADVFVALYYHVLRHDPKNPLWEDRDRLVLSNGHIVPVQYATMAHVGYFPKSELKTLRKFGSRLQGHPHRASLPGLETTSGPLGEHDAGNTWEAAMFAGKNNLHNLTAIMDRNNIQIDGYTEDIMPLEPLKEKYEAFNWRVIEVGGHSIGEIVNACRDAEATYEDPVLIIANTIPGYGVEYMQNKFEWHGKPPGSKQELRDALADLRTLGGKIESEHE
jgi:transketolase